MTHDDAAIMLLVQAGECARFAELVHRYRPALLRVAASKLGDAAAAEDVVQEAFLAVFVGRHTFDPRFSFRTWLWTILLNRCRKHLHRNRNHRRETSLEEWNASGWTPTNDGHDAGASMRREAEPASNAAWEDSGLARLLAAERRDRLHALLDQLPEPQADALRLRFFGGLKFQEIADAMESSLGGAKLRVRTGLETLAGLLRDDDRRDEGDNP